MNFLMILGLLVSTNSFAATATITSECWKYKNLRAGMVGEITRIVYLDKAGMDELKMDSFYRAQYEGGIHFTLTEKSADSFSSHYLQFPYSKETPSAMMKEIVETVKKDSATHIEITCGKSPYSDVIRIVR